MYYFRRSWGDNFDFRQTKLHHLIQMVVEHNGYEYLSDMAIAKNGKLKAGSLKIIMEGFGVERYRASKIIHTAIYWERQRIYSFYSEYLD